MGCEFGFGCNAGPGIAGQLLGQAKPLDGGTIRGVLAVCWRRDVLEEFWENSRHSRMKNKLLVIAGF